METKRLKSLVIRIDENRIIEVNESKTRAFLAEQKEKYHKLLKKYKWIKE